MSLNACNVFSRVIAEIDVDIESAIYQQGICGLSIALVQGNRTFWSKGYGYTDRSQREKVSPETLFSIQSIGKTFTATTFMIMASNGQIGLDDPIRMHYPEFTINTMGSEADIDKITFRRMLSHWAGFTHEATLGNNYDDTSHTYLEHIESIKDNWLRSTPGSEYSYSNIGYDLTGYVMGRKMDKTFPETVQDVLLKPLDINHATYNIEEALKQPFAKGHIGEFQTPTVQVPMLGGGGVYISANELAKLVSFHLRKGMVDGERLIEPGLFEDMYRTQFPDIGGTLYGLGVQVFQIDGLTFYGHGGDGYGYNSVMAWMPEHNIGIVILTNDQNHGLCYQVAPKALRLMMETIANSKTKLSPDQLKRVEGTYKAPRGPFIRITYENQHLHYYDTFNNEKPLTQITELEFASSDGTRYTFEPKNDRPSTLIIETPETKVRAKINDSPRDPEGPYKPQWSNHLGFYQYQCYGRAGYITIIKQNGYLYLIEDSYPLKLTEYRENIFFDSDGETLTINQDELIYRGIPATKVNHTVESLIEGYAKDPIMFRASRYNAMNQIIHFYHKAGLGEAFKLIEALEHLNGAPIDGYIKLGNILHILNQVQDAKTCYMKTLERDPMNKHAKTRLHTLTSIY